MSAIQGFLAQLLIGQARNEAAASTRRETLDEVETILVANLKRYEHGNSYALERTLDLIRRMPREPRR